MKKFLLGMLIAAIIVSGSAAYLIALGRPAAAQEQSEQVVQCTWGQIRLCYAGRCVPGCCDENCKGSP